MPANNAINSFLAGTQFRQGQEDRQRALADMQRQQGLENTRGKINALMMQPSAQAPSAGPGQSAGMNAGVAQAQVAQPSRQPSNMERARQLAVGSGDAQLLGQFQQEVAAMDDRRRAQAQALFTEVGRLGTSMVSLTPEQRVIALDSEAPRLMQMGVPQEEIMRYRELFADPQTSDAVVTALASRAVEAQSVFDAYAPQMQGENDVLTRFQGGQQVQGPVNPNAPINQGLEGRGLDIRRQEADTTRQTGLMNARTNRMEADLARQEFEAGQTRGPNWITLEPGDPRRAGFDENNVVQYNTETGQIARRSADRVFNATESEAAGFAGRMNDAGQIISQIERLPDFNGVPEFLWQRPTRSLPSEWQRYRQAGENWIRANLRRESGAVIGEDEMRDEFRVYFPQPGDSPQVIAQKAATRARAEQAMRAQSRGAYEEYGLDQVIGGASEDGPAVDPELLQFMPPQDRALFGG